MKHQHMPLLILILTLGRFEFVAADPPRVYATYLANEGVMIRAGDSTVLFDPLFSNSYGQYELLPEKMKIALFNGTKPFEDVDIILISHHHGDHFSPAEVRQLLTQRTNIKLFAPAQAIHAMAKTAPIEASLKNRITSITLAPGEAPKRWQVGDIMIAAAAIPHSGWPDRNTDVLNLAYRVSVASTTVLHIGDADTKDRHYASQAAFWSERTIDMAFPPYWYFISSNGQRVLAERLTPHHAVGVHVPTHIATNPENREPALQAVDLFTRPGERREIHNHAAPAALPGKGIKH